MTVNGWLQIALFFLLILACTKPLGAFIATVIEGKKNFLTPVLGPVERDHASGERSGTSIGPSCLCGARVIDVRRGTGAAGKTRASRHCESQRG